MKKSIIILAMLVAAISVAVTVGLVQAFDGSITNGASSGLWLWWHHHCCHPPPPPPCCHPPPCCWYWPH